MASPVTCPSCRALFAIPPDTDHFGLLGLPRASKVEESRLQSAHRALSRAVHPDRFVGQGDDTSALAVTLSAALNEAYAVLADPLRRADYLLMRAGGPSAMEERGVPGSLLAEVMMLREEIDVAREVDDRATLERMRGELTDRRRKAMANVELQVEQIDRLTEAQRYDVRRALNSLKYLDNLLVQAQETAPAQEL